MGDGGGERLWQQILTEDFTGVLGESAIKINKVIVVILQICRMNNLFIIINI